jgi:hypothetical protein
MFTVTLPYSTRSASMRLQVFAAAGQRPVAVVTQTDTEGVSLANGAEYFAAATWRRYFPDEPDPPLWVGRQITINTTTHFTLVSFQPGPDPYTLVRPRWLPLTDHEVAELVGSPVDAARGTGYLPHPPGPRPAPRYATTRVLGLPRPQPFREPACMPSGIPWWRRFARQILPRRGGRDCCWYHGGDWHRVSDIAIRLIEQAARDQIPRQEVPDWTCRQARAGQLSGWELEALNSLVDPALAVQPNEEGDGYLNGQHRSQAMLDAGVHRTLIVCWEHSRGG